MQSPNEPYAAHPADGVRAGERPPISVVITGYRRVAELTRTVESLRAGNLYAPTEWILADDGSPREMQEQMRALPFDHFALARRNRGLGANTNAGLALATAPLVLQLQDDWLFRGPGDFLVWGQRLLAERPDVGIVRYTIGFLAEPDEIHSLGTGPRARIYHPRPGSGIFLYCDHPHLKTRACIDFLGPYAERRYMQHTEIDMRDRFNAQSRFKVAYLDGYEAFEHIGADVSHRRRTPIGRLGYLVHRSPRLLRLVRRLRGRRSS